MAIAAIKTPKIKDCKFIFGHDGQNEYWVIADSRGKAEEVANRKFPKAFQKILKTEYSDQARHPNEPCKISYSPLHCNKSSLAENLWLKDATCQD